MELESKNFDPPLLDLTSKENTYFAPKTDPNRARLAFGTRAVPKLKRDLLVKDSVLACQTLESLIDLAHNSVKAFELIHQRVHIRLVRLMRNKNDLIREKTLTLLKVLGRQAGAKLAIMKNKFIVENLGLNLRDPVYSVRYQAALALSSIAENWIVVDSLNEADFIPLLIRCLLEDENDSLVICTQLEILTMLLDTRLDSTMQALANDACKLTKYLSDPRPCIRKQAAEIFLQIFQHRLGLDAAITHDIVPLLLAGLHDEVLEVKEKMCQALMFVGVTTEGKKKIVEDISVVDLLLHFIVAKYSSNGLKASALKILTATAELPYIRAKLLPIVDDLRSLNIGNEENLCRFMKQLIETILWKP